jgi:Zn-dependent metalloprotease
MRTPILFSLFILSISISGQNGRWNVNAILEKPQIADPHRQQELRKGNEWRSFIADHQGWAVEFNEASGKPHRAFGPPIATSGSSAEARAMQFISQHLDRFGVPEDELVHTGTYQTEKHVYVHFSQVHQQLPLIRSDLMVKFDQQHRVISFSFEVYDGIDIDVQPLIDANAATSIAASGIQGVTIPEFSGLKILPVPSQNRIDHRLVHEIIVPASVNGHPSRYRCWVDAHTGKLWYRWDEVLSCGHDGGDDVGAEVQVNGTVFPFNTLSPTEVVGLPDLRISINGQFHYTDANGYVSTGVAGPVSAQVPLRGRWSEVYSNNVMPSITLTLNEGLNTVDMDDDANVREISAYNFVNKIHQQANDLLPAFTGMDFALATNVDVTGGDCNAFYSGTSINFYAQGNGCHSLASIGDVVYHEYGHGINDKFYQSFGNWFNNGAMNEGYADVWAFSLTQDPILAQGYMIDDPNSSIRRYDEDPKVYPIDIVGEVHADGEIIAGAWWDTYMLLGQDMDLTMQLFADAFPGLQAAAFNGQEGQAFRDVLIDVLQADDDDGDITNGTPNGDAIVEAFAIHGITLLSNAELEHTAWEAAPAEESIDLSASVDVNFPFNTYMSGVRAFYRVNNDNSWQDVLMTNAGGDEWAASIPPQPQGSVIAYYLAIEDIFGNISSVQPIGAELADPNLPFFILVGLEVEATENGDDVHQLGNFETGIASDNATTGEWIWDVPLGSFETTSGQNQLVQTDHQHTPGGEFCWLTGNATSSTSGLGENDVDGGTTTLMSDDLDLTIYDEPVITYWRWYTNNPPGGANPGADWWQVYISNNGGDTWVPVEDTKTSERNWRRMAFRVNDHVTPTTEVRIKFLASDSIRAGEYLEGGSLVEAAIDDIQVWDLAGGIGIPEAAIDLVNVYPDPARDILNVDLGTMDLHDLQVEVLDLSGRVVLSPVKAATSRLQINVSGLAEGQYILRARGKSVSSERRFTVLK